MHIESSWIEGRGRRWEIVQWMLELNSAKGDVAHTPFRQACQFVVSASLAYLILISYFILRWLIEVWSSERSIIQKSFVMHAGFSCISLQGMDRWSVIRIWRWREINTTINSRFSFSGNFNIMSLYIIYNIILCRYKMTFRFWEESRGSGRGVECMGQKDAKANIASHLKGMQCTQKINK